MAPKDPTTKDSGHTAVADAEQAASVPQTPAEIAATEQALGLTAPAPKASGDTGRTQALQPKVPVRMGVAPTNIEEGWRLAQFIATSELVPKGYRGRPADVLVAIQYGMEVGLPPMAALHSIYVTNGRPSLWGDGFLAVIMASPVYKDHDEYYMVDGVRKDFLLGPDLLKDDTTAVTTFWRKDNERSRTATFSIAKAKKAGLWTKDGPWQNYPDRMLKYRARGFAGHDAFPDVLRGIRTAEEVIDMGPIEESPADAPRQVQRLSETPVADFAKGLEAAKARVQEAQAAGTTIAPTEVKLGPLGVKDVENFLGGFTITLTDGTQIDTTEMGDAIELEKFKGTPHKVHLTCVRDANQHLQLQSFGIAD